MANRESDGFRRSCDGTEDLRIDRDRDNACSGVGHLADAAGYIRVKAGTADQSGRSEVAEEVTSGPSSHSEEFELWRALGLCSRPVDMGALPTHQLWANFPEALARGTTWTER